jgi:prepilin-type N-terminal cleavage/methylation domain-containing protein
MALNSIKKMRKDSGFTIVELLIVIVVIAILATISIVAYSGIQSRAKTTKAQANASQVQKIAEAFYADNSRYPGTRAEFTNAVTNLPAGVTLLITTSTLSNTNGENSIDYDIVGTSANATGGRVRYWDFTTGAVATNIIYLGSATSGSTWVELPS